MKKFIDNAWNGLKNIGKWTGDPLEGFHNITQESKPLDPWTKEEVKKEPPGEYKRWATDAGDISKTIQTMKAANGGAGIPIQTPIRAYDEEEQPKPKHHKIFTEDEVNEILGVKQLVLKTFVPAIKNYGPNHVIAGGVFVSLFHNEPYKDVDVFVLNCKESDDITRHLHTTNKNDRYKFSDIAKYTKNPNVIACVLDTETKIQTIFTKYKTRQEVLKGFDFVHCCASIQEGQMHIGREIYDAIKKKNLIINNVENLQAYRREKFLNLGFREE